MSEKDASPLIVKQLQAEEERRKVLLEAGETTGKLTELVESVRNKVNAATAQIRKKQKTGNSPK